MYTNLTADQAAYFEQIWDFVRQVPNGMVVTYGQIAQTLPAPDSLKHGESDASGSRLVGSAMAACPDDVPWHRVINAQGKVSNRPGALQQQQLLESEGLSFHQSKLNLDECQWPGPGQPDRPKQQQLF